LAGSGLGRWTDGHGMGSFTEHRKGSPLRQRKNMPRSETTGREPPRDISGIERKSEPPSSYPALPDECKCEPPHQTWTRTQTNRCQQHHCHWAATCFDLHPKGLLDSMTSARFRKSTLHKSTANPFAVYYGCGCQISSRSECESELVAKCSAGFAGTAGLHAECRAADPFDTRMLAANNVAAQHEPSNAFPARLFSRQSSKAVSCSSCGKKMDCSRKSSTPKMNLHLLVR
jgi:hypothetical protein